MKTKSRIEKQLRKKTNTEVVETIINSKKSKNWLDIARVLSAPRRKRIIVNLDKINSESKDGDSILIPGKILSKGNVDKKLKSIISLNISKEAEKKLSKTKVKYSNIIDEIKKNPDAKGIKIIK